jgi:LacI family transcriptional regulator
MPSGPHVTLRDIAKKSGYHFTTVGAALRSDSRIPVATQKRIRKLADKLGYRANPVLSALTAYRSTRERRHMAGLIGYLTTYDIRDLVRANPREKRVVQAATQQAESLSFKLDPIRIDEAGLTPQRVNAMLQARGITAIILAPRLPIPGPIMELDWDKFAVVALGYSITNIRPHRVCYHQFQSMSLNLAELRKRGYQRIGLAMHENLDVRSNGLFLGAYLAEQCRRPVRDHVPPLVLPGMRLTPDKLIAWVRETKPDCVVTADAAAAGWLREAGLRVPADVGVAHLSLEANDATAAGIDEQCERLGAAAIDLMSLLLRANERGLSLHPRYTLVEGRWVDGPTVRTISR